jgi:hypothetical protein
MPHDILAKRQTSHLLIWCLALFVLYARPPQSSFPRKRESRTARKSWIPGRGSYRQLARNDVEIITWIQETYTNG